MSRDLLKEAALMSALTLALGSLGIFIGIFATSAALALVERLLK